MLAGEVGEAGPLQVPMPHHLHVGGREPSRLPEIEVENVDALQDPLLQFVVRCRSHCPGVAAPWAVGVRLVAFCHNDTQEETDLPSG
jgi:hypothetical protein